MDVFLLKLLRDYFTPQRTELYTELYELIKRYNYEYIDENLENLINTDIIEDNANFSLQLNDVFYQATHDVLINLYLIPNTRDIDVLYKLLSGIYLLEHHMGHEHIVDVIESKREDSNPREILITLLEEVCDRDWVEMSDAIKDASNLLIKNIYHLHLRHHESEITSNPELIVQERLDNIRKYFSLNSDTFVLRAIEDGFLRIPSDVNEGGEVLNNMIMDVIDPVKIARECYSLAMITPVKEASLLAQAKKIVNKFYVDTDLITKVVIQLEIMDKDHQLSLKVNGETNG